MIASSNDQSPEQTFSQNMAKATSLSSGGSPNRLTYNQNTAYLTNARDVGKANKEVLKQAFQLQTKIDGSKFKEFPTLTALQSDQKQNGTLPQVSIKAVSAGLKDNTSYYSGRTKEVVYVEPSLPTELSIKNLHDQLHSHKL